MKHWLLVLSLITLCNISNAQDNQNTKKDRKEKLFEEAKRDFINGKYENVIRYCDSISEGVYQNSFALQKMKSQSYTELAKMNKEDSIQYMNASNEILENVTSIYGKMRVATEWDSLKIDMSSPQYSYINDIDQKPQFPGGEKEIYKFIKKEFKYPKEAKKQNAHGKIYLGFVVNKDGSVDAVNILRGGGKKTFGCDKEAIRVISSLPNFIPGMHQGKPVYCRYAVPIVY
ncbi:energy transducer TonB [Aquimarina pacifica]|uniref:energy transducer TonB n=1 Tax=Aquimarina pacifica TaxID=1296415 RepID=UPI0004B02C5F|nr:energy transducer TonB [Aquimarina pacifica]